MTSAELLSRVRTIIDETESGGLVSDSEIYLALSEAQLHLASTLASLNSGDMVMPALSKLIATQQTSPASTTETIDGITVKFCTATIPDCLKVIKHYVKFRDSGGTNYFDVYRGIYVAPEIFKMNWHYKDSEAVYYYFIRSKTLFIAHRPSSNFNTVFNVFIDYIQIPSNISSTSQPSLIGCDGELVSYAAATILNKLRVPQAQIYSQQYLQLLTIRLQTLGVNNAV